MSKIRFLVDNFPNADWNYEWYSGQFFSEGSFPPLLHYLGAALVGWLGASLGASLIVIAAASFIVIASALYGFVRTATGSRLAGLIATLVLISANAFWSYALEGGLYPRILGMGFLSLFAFFVVLHHVRPSQYAFVAMVLSLAATLSTHLLLGGMGVALAIGAVAVLPLSMSQKLVQVFKLLGVTSLVVAFFYLPYFIELSRRAPVPTFTREYGSVSWSSLFVGMESVPVLVGALAVLAPVVAYRYRQLFLSALPSRMMAVAAAVTAACLVYALAGLGGTQVFIYNFQPGQAMFFASWFLAALVGLALPWTSARRAMVVAVVVALMTQLLLITPGLAGGTVNGDNPSKRQLQNALLVSSSQKDYRVGVNWDGASDWINSHDEVPQTRGYQQQGVVNGDWQYWLETRVWNSETNYAEKDFLLDWFAVKQFYAGPDAAAAQRFAERPDLYASTNALTFEYLDAAPIISARATRTALVIGDDTSYDLVLRSIALAGFDSRSLIPVRGGSYIDDVSASEFAQFDLVILYGYRFHDQGKAFALLDSYVKEGGGLLVEGGNPILEQTASAPSPIPGAPVRRKGIGPAWRLTPGEGPIPTGVDLNFAPAVYNGGPWGVSYIPKESIASWAAPALLSDGDPVVVAGTLGTGRVVWSGMNLPFHITSNRAAQESRLFTREISWAAPRQSAEPAYKATFISAQHRRVVIEGQASGVLLKESWVPNWQASIGGESLTIYRAGPDFMYVSIPRGLSYPATLDFEFTHSSIELIGDAVSVLGLVGLLAWLVVGRVRRRRLH